MGVDHGRAHIPVPQQLLNCSNVISILKQVSDKGMARLVKIAAGGAGGRAPDLRGPELFGDEVDDALLGLEGPGDS